MFVDEMARLLVHYGVGELATSIFIGSTAVIPAGDGPYLTIVDTGGVAPKRVQNGRILLQCPTAQILVRARPFNAARQMAAQAYDALDGRFNLTWEGVFYVKIAARQEPTDAGMDSAGRPCVVFNIEAEKEPS